MFGKGSNPDTPNALTFDRLFALYFIDQQTLRNAAAANQICNKIRFGIERANGGVSTKLTHYSIM